MYPYLGNFATGVTIFFPFCTYNSSGASVTITGLATTDIEVYKGASMTQRASDAGFTLVDTDGIDIDSTTGLHGFTIDTSDNSDAGFYAAGYDYTVVVSTITADSQTVTFIAGRFSLQNRVTDVRAINASTTAASNLAYSAGVMLYGTVDGTGTNSTTQIETTATSEATANHFVGRAVFFTSGALQYQAAKITAYSYVSSRGRFTVETMTDTPAGSDAFIIV